jgi:hypothetical protein
MVHHGHGKRKGLLLSFPKATVCQAYSAYVYIADTLLKFIPLRYEWYKIHTLKVW